MKIKINFVYLSYFQHFCAWFRAYLAVFSKILLRRQILFLRRHLQCTACVLSAAAFSHFFLPFICFVSMEAQSMPEQQQASEAGTNNTRHKRPIKPEEQALLDELKILAEQHGQQFPTICSFVKKGESISESHWKYVRVWHLHYTIIASELYFALLFKTACRDAYALPCNLNAILLVL